MTSTNINYVATYFEFPELDKIHGEPTYAKLCKIKDQIKANALSVSSKLGRGGHGHLGLVLINSEYANITATRKDEDTNILFDIQTYAGPLVTLPNVKNIYATQQGNLPLSNKLSKKAKIVTILPELRSSSLLSLGQLYDGDCDILLNKKQMYVIKDKELILQGTRKKLDGL